MRRVSRRGFTIIELMVAMAIILILVSLVVVGVRVLTTNGKNGQTQTYLQALSGVTAELKVKLGPTSPLFQAGQSPMISPGDVTTNSPNRIIATAILATASVMAQAQAIPDVQTAINGLQPSQLMPFAPPAGRVWVWTPNAPYRASLDYVEYDNTAGNPPTEQVFICTVTGPNPTAAPPFDSGEWSAVALPIPQITQATTRIPLDAWGNPMIFVPASGLAGVMLADGNYHTIVSPDGQPFWASAGPDGNFSKGDDNIYSFQK